MKKKFFRIPAFSALTFVLLAVLVLGVSIVYPAWLNGSTSLTINKGDSAIFLMTLTSSNPPVSYAVAVYDSTTGQLIDSLGGSSVSSNAEDISVTILPDGYGNLGGTYIIRIVADDQYLSDFDETLTLTVLQAAPQVSNLPDVQMEQDEVVQAFDLDDFVSDADDPLSALTWTVSGNTNITVTIDSGNVVTLFPEAGFVGTNVLTFTVTDPSGDSDSDTINVEVFADGDLPKSKKSSLKRVNVEFFNSELLKIRNTGPSIEDFTLKLTFEGIDILPQKFKFDLDTNRVTYKILD